MKRKILAILVLGVAGRPTASGAPAGPVGTAGSVTIVQDAGVG